METIGSLAVVTGFLPQFITRCSSTYQYSYITDQEAWNTDHGSRNTGHGGCDIYVTLFEMSLNCVRIVAKLRQKVTTLWVSWGCREVSWVSRKLYFLYTYVAGRLELFQCSLKSATMWPESRHLTTLFSNTRPLHDTLGVVRFKSIKGRIPRILRDRSRIFTSHDTFPDFSAQNIKKIKKTSLGIAVFIALFQTQLRHRKV